MGTVNHNAIIATTYADRIADEFEGWLKANDISFYTRSESVVNNYITFFFPPDGSNEFWGESDTGDHLRSREL